MRTRIVEMLQSETRAQSSIAEADAMAYVADCSRERVREYLAKSYGFEAPLESACVMTFRLASQNAASRPRTRLIARDLVELGMSPERLLELRPCPLGPLRDVSQALGWLYVAERNVLTNTLLHQHLATRAPELAARASYLNCYGAATEARWHRFAISVERTAARADAARITASAIGAYAFLHSWLQIDQV